MHRARQSPAEDKPACSFAPGLSSLTVSVNGPDWFHQDTKELFASPTFSNGREAGLLWLLPVSQPLCLTADVISIRSAAAQRLVAGAGIMSFHPELRLLNPEQRSGVNHDVLACSLFYLLQK